MARQTPGCQCNSICSGETTSTATTTTTTISAFTSTTSMTGPDDPSPISLKPPGVPPITSENLGPTTTTFLSPSPSSATPNVTNSTIPSVISYSASQFPTPTSITLDQGPPPTPSIPSPQGVTVTVTPTPTVPAALSTASPSNARANHSINGAKLAEILVPIIVVVALIPLLYLCYLRRRIKRDRRGLPELRLPQETTLLHSRHDSMTRSTPSPFSDNEYARSDSFGTDDGFKTNSVRLSGRPSSEIFRVPSPNLPSPSQPAFRAQESWPLTSVPADPPPNYEAQSASLRPPSSIHDRAANRSRTASLTEGYPSSYRASDTVSELSFDHRSRERSMRDSDEMSFVSALESDDAGERNLSRMV